MQANKVIITCVNQGYIPLLENLRYTLRAVGLLDSLRVFSVGKKCQISLANRGIESSLVEACACPDAAVHWNTKRWKMMTYNKIRAIKQSLDIYDGFLYTDPDVVFQRDVFLHFESLPEGFDVYGQKDIPKSDICSGFMYIKKTANTKKVFSVSWNEYERDTNIGDQVYINNRKNQLSFYGLSENLFLNGVWFDPSKSEYTPTRDMIESAYIVHYNWTHSAWEKYVRMKKNRHVYVNPTLIDIMIMRIRGFLHK